MITSVIFPFLSFSKSYTKNASDGLANISPSLRKGKICFNDGFSITLVSSAVI
jgi:hypothetical protein